jgi:hypothetical protein
MKQTMFDARCDLAALVYEPHQDPDAVLRGFASDLQRETRVSMPPRELT